MDEVVPGIFHWTTHHEGIGLRVSSHYVADGATLIDPRVPDGGLERVEALGRPRRIVLSNRHHLRHSERFAEAFDCPVLCHEAGLHEFSGGPAVEGFAFGDEVAPGITALEVDAICTEDSALLIAAGDGALLFADGLVRIPEDGPLGFVPDFLMGDDPAAVKRGLRASLERLAGERFDHLLFAHGLPLAGGGRAALRDFLESSAGGG